MNRALAKDFAKAKAKAVPYYDRAKDAMRWAPQLAGLEFTTDGVPKFFDTEEEAIEEAKAIRKRAREFLEES